MDEFGDAIQLSTPKGLVDSAWAAVGGGTTVASASTIFIALVSIILITRVLSSRSAPIQKGSINAVPILPYSVPLFKHAFSFLFDKSFLERARDASHYGIFGIQAGPYTANVITDPDLVTAAIHHKESNMQFFPLGWRIMRNVFGVQGGKKLAVQWQAAFAPLQNVITSHMMKEPQLGKMVNRVIGKMERAIPSMITFTENPIDQQPWEKVANVSVFPSEIPEAYLNLMELMRHLLGEVSIPAIMGDRFLEKYPNTLTDLFTMDDAFMHMAMGVSRFFPLPKVFRAYLARRKLLESLKDFGTALDMVVGGNNPASDSPGWDWGDFDDVSEMLVRRAEIYREYGFRVEDQCELSILWAFTANSTMLVYWHVLYILSTPNLLPQILSEIAPYAAVTPPVTINGFSSTPSLKLSAEGLSESCPLFKSTYFETLRLVNQATSVRIVGNDVIISSSKSSSSSPPTSFNLSKSTYVLIPSSLHASDPVYFRSPSTFIPDRFIIASDTPTSSPSNSNQTTTPTTASNSSANLTPDQNSPQSHSRKADPLTTRPYGGGPTICKGRLLAEKECLALVAGVLVMWEIEPADPKKGWKIPGLVRKSAISEPRVDTRVKVRRRL